MSARIPVIPPIAVPESAAFLRRLESTEKLDGKAFWDLLANEIENYKGRESGWANVLGIGAFGASRRIDKFLKATVASCDACRCDITIEFVYEDVVQSIIVAKYRVLWAIEIDTNEGLITHASPLEYFGRDTTS